jgi:starch-binding outer membrane protein, SusD/RagB family
MMRTLTHRLRRAMPASTMALAMLALGACGVQDSLLEQQQPQIIRPTDVQSSTGALGLYTGALGRLRFALNGGNNNQEGIWGFESLMTDEVQSADSFSQRNDADQRTTQTNDANVQVAYERVQQSRGFARDAINALRTYAPTEIAKQAEMYMELGFMEKTLGQAFCNGIPLGETINGVPQYTDPLPDSMVFKAAIVKFDSALTLLTGTDVASNNIRSATRIAKAGAQVNLGQYAAAATTVQGIPTSYAYLITYSQTTQSNEWWQMFTSSKRYSVGDSVDPSGTVRILNAVPFYSANDPRVKSKPPNGVGLDTKTPFTEMTNWGREDPVSLVNGLDARLIEAEALLQTNDFVGMNGILNTLRSAPPKYGNLTIAAMTALPVPATRDAAIDQLFREKAFWQYGRGERFSDLRRLVRQYSRTQDKVWPSGTYFKNGVYGTNVTFPVPDSEKSNPKFTGCMDMKP